MSYSEDKSLLKRNENEFEEILSETHSEQSNGLSFEAEAVPSTSKSTECTINIASSDEEVEEGKENSPIFLFGKKTRIYQIL
jgi:hypothetical protein